MMRAALVVLLLAAAPREGALVLVEAESFERHGGWQLDTQFIASVGSPYLLAHGLGRPVEDAVTPVTFAETGKYRVFVRTKDWVARWNAPGHPGRFQLLIDGKPLSETFGTKGAEWTWQDGGIVEISKSPVAVALHDLTGFDGRCDAILFARETAFRPPAGGEALKEWRRKTLGLPEKPADSGPYDLVVVGGGYAGMGAALSAARMGIKVALLQDRPVLGGNGSSEVRVWAMGLVKRGRFPRIGEIIEEFCDHAKKSPGTWEEFGDAKKEEIVRAEKNIDLFLNHHADGVEKEGDRITAVLAFDTRTSARRRFPGRLIADCTGHAVIGALAGADSDMTPKGRMGMSNMWRWKNEKQPTAFPETPWALDLAMDDFPYPRDFHAEWFWEGGFDKDPLGDSEGIRDWNLRAVYGAFNAMKNRDGAAKHPNASLEWVAYVGGPRESRRLMGDVVLSQEDIVSKRDFPDGCVPSTWSIDLHYPKAQFAKKYPDNPFISIAKFDARVDRAFGYPVPYRCFYSRNIPNLFMAGRDISVTHEALGTVRVMKTCGMMGEVVGKAASICVKRHADPRDIYQSYLDELKQLLELPGKARRASVNDPIDIPAGTAAATPPAPDPGDGIDPKSLPGIVIDDPQAIREGNWTHGRGLKGYVGDGYLYAGAGAKASIRFEFSVPSPGKYEVRIAYQPHENRATRAAVTVKDPSGEKTHRINMRVAPPLEKGFLSLGVYDFPAGGSGAVILSTEGADGNVHADAVQLLPSK